MGFEREIIVSVSLKTSSAQLTRHYPCMDVVLFPWGGLTWGDHSMGRNDGESASSNW